MAAEEKEIIVVCTGNTCRSPMGERLLAHALAAEPPPLNKLRVTSAGVSAFPGDAPSPQSVKALRKVGLDLSNHRSRRLTTQMTDNALAIFVMTEGHRNFIEMMQPDSQTPVLLFRELMGNSAEIQVPDPFGGSLVEYEETRDALAEAIPAIVAYLRTLVTPEKNA